MKNIILIISVLLFANNATGYEGNPTSQVDQFFSEISAGKADQAIDNLYSNNPTMQQKIQALTVLKQQINSLGAFYGNYLGFEKVSYEEISPSVVRMVTVAKYEVHPIVWEFYFYKPKNTWIISQAMFVDQFQVLGAKK
ncbi:hypothetical protein QSV34_06875 [Porticoccus sp. W117]|uniref:hypothetical protein n=1 Tax=Porticoccus sp. W117 TaxID=3054777 RepID=UPI002591D55D|nr:hypothetical protein [Porticoccus sp. W117]MDM3871078.1 hypothetical protein [Porticoccus sp. W117]